ncbi:MAG: hypothetical protein WBF43_04160 [Methylocella sp.]
MTKTSIGGRDMSFRDGQCRSRKDHAPADFTPLKHMAHKFARKAAGKDSLRLKREAAPRDGEFLASLTAAGLFHPIPKKSNN